jgi:nicotinate-nucleotide pyrophosphorylase (carboxylating)
LHIPPFVRSVLRLALEEDMGPCDLTTALVVPERRKTKALIISKGAYIIAGMPFFMEVFRTLDREVEFGIFFDDGSPVEKGDVVVEVSGLAGPILSSERVALNVLQRLSGIATLTREYVQKVKDMKVRIVDTRKTTPCLRYMEKYAVRVGGGSNHRYGLYDGILIKDNHIKTAGGISAAVQAAKKAHHLVKIEVEVENLSDLREALMSGADVVMLDNMPVEEMKEAVEVAKGRAIIEASGNISLDRVREIAETGVDLISIGALTHSAPAADISMEMVWTECHFHQ